MDNGVQDCIEHMNRLKDTMHKATEQTDDVKAGNCTAEDEQAEPSYKLYNGIVDSTIEILKQPSCAELYKKLEQKLDLDTVKALIEFMSVSMASSAYNAILIYDSLLKNELTAQFDNVAKHLNQNIADIRGINSAMEVFKHEIGAITKKLEMDQIASENNVSVE